MAARISSTRIWPSWSMSPALQPDSGAASSAMATMLIRSSTVTGPSPPQSPAHATTALAGGEKAMSENPMRTKRNDARRTRLISYRYRGRRNIVKHRFVLVTRVRHPPGSGSGSESVIGIEAQHELRARATGHTVREEPTEYAVVGIDPDSDSDSDPETDRGRTSRCSRRAPRRRTDNGSHRRAARAAERRRCARSVFLGGAGGSPAARWGAALPAVPVAQRCAVEREWRAGPRAPRRWDIFAPVG